MAFDPYASARPFFSPKDAPSHVVTQADKDRLQSYDLYQNIYWTQPNTFKLQQRGQDASPIYLPSPRKLIEACNRFLAVDFGYLITATTDAIRAQLQALVAKVFAREDFFSKFNSQKRYGLIKGAQIWHIVGESKAQPGLGQNIDVLELDPSNYFPIVDPDDADKVVGCHLVDIIVDPADANKNRTLARRQTYRKEPDGTISSELVYCEPDKWDDRNLKPSEIKIKQIITPKFSLPSEITALPVYHIKNSRIPGQPFGVSELLGMERVMAAVNQSVSDEELALAMAGLGVFFTTSGPPRTADGRTGAWELGPAIVVEGSKDSRFDRISGVTTVAPMLDHMKFILGEMASSFPVPDVAAGKVDVSVAESGISLQLQLSPLLAHNAEKEGSMLGVYDQMFFDLLHMWLPAFEGVPAEVPAALSAVVGDPMPKNRQAQIDEIIKLVQAKLLSIEEGRAELIKLGYNLAVNADGQPSADPIINQERQMALAASADDFSDRVNRELDGAGAGA
jgi:hypothetical protein